MSDRAADQVSTDASTVALVPGSEPTARAERSQVDASAQTMATTDGAAPRPAGRIRARGTERYVIERELARGGMGRISVAHDGLLGRTVALKELLRPDDGLAARFHRELSLTARLQHPSIVSIHDAGTWPGGDPFYVMRLVSGESLDRVIARHASVAERLALLPIAIAAVDALAYAHAQGIIHRDLKPANILVGEYGETVVIDWGLAKDLRASAGLAPVADAEPAGEGETIAGAVLGTPAFMAPEQAYGDPLDERADVYALGAVLYCAFAGTAPYAGPSTAAVLAQVIDGPPPSIREVAPGLPADLATIIEKAMAREPADRYRTAGELANDLKRYQRGQLVAAHRYSRLQLVKRWLRRHRTVASVTAIALVAVAIVSIASVRRIVREQARADDERTTAIRHRAEAEELVDFLLTELNEKLGAFGKLDLMEAPARKALAYYERRGSATPRDLHRVSLARLQLGRVLQDRGDTRGALAELRISLEYRARLAALEPGLVRHRSLAVTRDAIGEILAAQGDARGALREYQLSLALVEPYARAAPHDRALQRDVFVSRTMIGEAFEQLQDLAAADGSYRAAHALATELARSAPDDADAQRDLLVSHQKLGSVRLARQDVAGALAEFRISAEITRRLATRDPADAQLQRDLSNVHTFLGKLLLDGGDRVGALAELRESRRIIERLVARDPSNATWQHDLEMSHLILGETLLAIDDLDGALTADRAALAIATELATADASNVQRTRELEVALNRIGDVQMKRRDPRAALASYREALTIAERLAGQPDGGPWQEDLAFTQRAVATALTALHREPEALAIARAALVIEATLVVAAPDQPDRQYDLARAHEVHGDALVRRAPRAARAAYQAADAQLEGLARKDPDNARWQQARSTVLAKIASVPHAR